MTLPSSLPITSKNWLQAFITTSEKSIKSHFLLNELIFELQKHEVHDNLPVLNFLMLKIRILHVLIFERVIIPLQTFSSLGDSNLRESLKKQSLYFFQYQRIKFWQLL